MKDQTLNDGSAKKPKSIRRFLTVKQASTFLKIKISTVYSIVAKGGLSLHSSCKNQLLLSRSELEQLFNSRKVNNQDKLNGN